MFESNPKEPQQAKLRFGGGVNSRASQDEINPRECVEGQNFNLDVENTNFTPRKPFSKYLEYPFNEGQDFPLVGFSQHYSSQSGIEGKLITNLYYWTRGYGELFTHAFYVDDSGNTVTQNGNFSYEPAIEDVAPKIRGPLSAYDAVSQSTVVTDLAGVAEVISVSAVTPDVMTHNLPASAMFYARYAFVSGERMWYGNIVTGAPGIPNVFTPVPHMIVGSKVEDHDNLSVSNKPSSALGEDDPFYILAPDLNPINGIVGAFGQVAFSTLRGSIHNLTGFSAKDFDLDSLYQNSGATGYEGFTFAGNDVVYSRPGYIESLAGVQAFGDVENDDLSRAIKYDFVNDVSFKLAWEPVTKKLYVLPEGSDTLWVFHKSFYDKLAKDVSLLKSGASLSPWVPWVSSHPQAFENVENMWTMIDPFTGLEGVFFATDDRHLYKLDGGEYGEGDGGESQYEIAAYRTSIIVEAPSGDFNNVSGWVKYAEESIGTLIGIINIGGTRVGDHEFQILLKGEVYENYYNGDFAYYNGDTNFYGLFASRRQRKEPYSVSGIGSQLQITVRLEGTDYFEIAEVGLEFTG